MKISEKSKSVFLTIGKISSIVVVNCAIYAWIILNLIEVGSVEISKQHFTVSQWDTLSVKFKIITWVFMGIGVLASFFIAKFWYKTHKEKKEIERQEKLELEKQKTLEKTIEKVVKSV